MNNSTGQVTALLSVVIPTYGRGEIVLDTVRMLVNLAGRPDEIIVADQTLRHDPAVDAELQSLADAGDIRWLRLERPSIPCAMNQGLLAARGDIVLFLDDDIIPGNNLVTAHKQAYRDQDVTVVAGRVLQPWDSDDAPPDDGVFRFSGKRRCLIEDFMGGNFSVRRDIAIDCGGFDENFVQVAHWFEKEFADRLKLQGLPILFEPEAVLRHLKAERGGIRAYGQWRKTIKPGYSVGSYYYLMRSTRIRRRLIALILRPLRTIRTRHHLAHPWWIPPTLIAEVLAFFWAFTLVVRGPRFIDGAGRGGKS